MFEMLILSRALVCEMEQSSSSNAESRSQPRWKKFDFADRRYINLLRRFPFVLVEMYEYGGACLLRR